MPPSLAFPSMMNRAQSRAFFFEGKKGTRDQAAKEKGWRTWKGGLEDLEHGQLSSKHNGHLAMTVCAIGTRRHITNLLDAGHWR